ncbi:MAG: hypothetical protein U1E70_06630 [Acetobacteraceae bacterium]
MSLPASIPDAIVETILLRLLTLFLSGADGDAAAARAAALHMLGSFRPTDEQQLCLAADIVSFELHALEALRQSDEPDIPAAQILRLRGGAVSMNREAHRARQELQRLQRAAAPDMPADTPPEADATPATAVQMNAAEAVELVEEACRIAAAAAQDVEQGRHAGLSYSQALQKRMTAQRLLAKQKSRAADPATRLAVPPGAPLPVVSAAPA